MATFLVAFLLKLNSYAKGIEILANAISVPITNLSIKIVVQLKLSHTTEPYSVLLTPRKRKRL